MNHAAPEALLFDPGGVVIDIDFEQVFRIWQPISRLSLDKIRTTFGFDQAYPRHERGEIEAPAFYTHLSELLQLQAEHPDIARGWNDVFVDNIAATTALARKARRKLPCYGFTNTNAAHKAMWSRLFLKWSLHSTPCLHRMTSACANPRKRHSITLPLP